MFNKIYYLFNDSLFKRNFSYLLLGDIVSRAMQFLTVVYLARVLTDTKYGIIVFALTIQTYLLNFVDFGLPMIGTRELAREKDANNQTLIVGQILVIRTIISVLVFLISTAFTFVFIDTIESRLVMIATFAFVFPQSLNLDWIYQGFERMKVVGINRIAYQMTTFVLILIFVTRPLDVVAVPIIRLTAGLVFPFLVIYLSSANLKCLINVIPKFSLLLNGWKVIFKEALPLAGCAFLGLVFNTFDIFYLGIKEGVKVVAWYNTATVFFAFEIAIAATMFQTFYPRLSRAYASHGNKEFPHVYRLYKRSMFWVGIATTLMPAIFGPYLLRFFFGSSYSNAGAALSILMVTAFVAFMNHTFGGALLAVGLQKYSLAATIVGAMVSIISVLVLVPKYSLIGAAMSRLMAETASATVHYVYTKRFFHIYMKKESYD